MTLRVGILLDSRIVPAWAYSLLAAIDKLDCASIVLIVLNGAPPPPGGRRSAAARRHRLFHLYMRLEKFLCRPRPDAFAPLDASGLLGQAEVLEVVPVPVGGEDDFAAADLEAIRSRRLDALVQLGFGHPSAGIRGAARYGVWALRHLDVDNARGAISGFWEVFRRHPVTGGALQVLDDTIFGGLTLARSYSATTLYSVLSNRNRCHWLSVEMIPHQLRQLHALGADAFFARASRRSPPLRFYDRPFFPVPGNLAFLRLLARHAWFTGKGLVRDLFTREEWFLRFRIGDGISTEFHRFDGQLRAPRGRFFADPHIVEKDGTYFVFFESSPYAGGRGCVQMTVIDSGGRCSKPETVLERPYHLAYPSVIRWRGNYYMIPDSGANRSVDAYRCDGFPRRWSFHKTLIGGIRGVDPNLFEHGGRWWMFLSVIEHEGGSYSDELFLYSADHPLSDRWSPHPLNPIVSDVRKARAGGPVLKHRGRLYRLSQDCSHGYGYGLNLHEIILLDEERYEEKDVQSIEPRWDPRITGLHTLAHAGNLTVIDVKTRRLKILS